jgi:N-acetylglucosaminyldiphosphoundecaprenol N-acetyl-beta-D-mannosaminyltransferase
VSGVRIFDGDLADAVSLLRRRAATGVGTRVATANLDFLALAAGDPVLAHDLETSDLVVADGAPVAWLARRAGARHIRRCAGVDLVTELCRISTRESPLRVVLYGGLQQVADGAAARLVELGGGIDVVGIITPPFRPLSEDERDDDLRKISLMNPNVVLVALGCPRQERVIADYFRAAPAAVWIGVGGTLDFLAGRRKRAPGWIRASGLEWVARLVQEPGRLGRRYVLRDIPFLARLLAAEACALVPGVRSAAKRG